MKLSSWCAVATACLVSFAASAQEVLTKLEFKEAGVEAVRKLVLEHETGYRDAIKGGMMVPEDITIAEYDIAGDEALDVFAYIPSNSLYCGSQGCSLTVYERAGDTLKKIMDVVTYPDVSVSSVPTRGHRDIVLRDGKGKPLHWKFDGKQYSR